MKLIFFIFLGFCFGACTSSSSSESTSSTSTHVPQIPDTSSYETFIKALCKNHSTCNVTGYKPPSDYWSNRNCLCDQNCAIYGDCCPDSPFYKEQQKTNYDSFKCSNIISESEELHYYMKQSCPSGYTNGTIKSNCENHAIGGFSTDVKMMKPVTDTKQNITYANEYCALCNGVADFQTWSLRFSCYQEGSTTPVVNASEITGIFMNVKLNRTTGSYHSSFNGQNYECKHTFPSPSHSLRQFIRPCYPNVISKCSGVYDRVTSDRCHSFTTHVHLDVQGISQTYRNEYCAKCNGVTKLDPTACIAPAGTGPSPFYVFATDYGKYDPSDICNSASVAIRKQFC